MWTARGWNKSPTSADSPRSLNFLRTGKSWSSVPIATRKSATNSTSLPLIGSDGVVDKLSLFLELYIFLQKTCRGGHWFSGKVGQTIAFSGLSCFAKHDYLTDDTNRSSFPLRLYSYLIKTRT